MVPFSSIWLWSSALRRPKLLRFLQHFSRWRTISSMLGRHLASPSRTQSLEGWQFHLTQAQAAACLGPQQQRDKQQFSMTPAASNLAMEVSLKHLWCLTFCADLSWDRPAAATADCHHFLQKLPVPPMAEVFSTQHGGLCAAMPRFQHHDLGSSIHSRSRIHNPRQSKHHKHALSA